MLVAGVDASTRVLWCYAFILTAARDRPPPPHAAKPAVSVSKKPLL